VRAFTIEVSRVSHPWKLSGRLVLLVVLLATPAAASAPVTGSAVGRVREQVGKDEPRPVKGAVVYLVHVEPTRAARARRPVTIQQRDLKFEPAFTVVMQGDTIEFPNQERNAVDHNVFSPRVPGRLGFDLGRYGRGTSRPWVFREVGVYDLFCNLHEDMKAQVKVLENAYFAFTDAQGAFRLPSVPAGRYEIRAWRPYTVEALGTVEVIAGAASARVDLVFKSAASPPRRHKRLDGSAYKEAYD